MHYAKLPSIMNRKCGVAIETQGQKLIYCDKDAVAATISSIGTLICDYHKSVYSSYPNIWQIEDI